jgi:molecular chaperone GrpE
MIFKKRKSMKEQQTHTTPDTQEPTTDNLSQNNNTEPAEGGPEVAQTAEEQVPGLNRDEDMPGSVGVEETLAADVNGETEKLRAELAEAKDKYIRLVAEFDNFRRRNAKERMELIQTAGRDVVQSLLVVLDDCDRAARTMESSADLTQIKEGVGLVFHKLRHALEQKGLKVMESKGKDFDPELHEAITEIPAPTPELAGKVVDEVEPGYYLNERLIRHAKVVVGKSAE